MHDEAVMTVGIHVFAQTHKFAVSSENGIPVLTRSAEGHPHFQALKYAMEVAHLWQKTGNGQAIIRSQHTIGMNERSYTVDISSNHMSSNPESRKFLAMEIADGMIRGALPEISDTGVTITEVPVRAGSRAIG